LPRTSGLQAPIMELTGIINLSRISWIGVADMSSIGHSGEVFVTRFDPTGEHIASGSMDRSIRTWVFYTCSNPTG
jgi:Prp8 binding protein